MRWLMASTLVGHVRAAYNAFARSGPSSLSIIFFICAVLLADLDARGGGAIPPLDPDRGVILPSALAEGIFKQHRSNVVLQVDDWQITPDDLSHVDAALTSALKRESVGSGSATPPNYYRQYVPGRFHQSRVIYVNGFEQTESEMFPDRGIPADRWKHTLVIAYGGGCGFWYGIYLIDEGRLLLLDHTRNRRIICNAPK